MVTGTGGRRASSLRSETTTWVESTAGTLTLPEPRPRVCLRLLFEPGFGVRNGGQAVAASLAEEQMRAWTSLLRPRSYRSSPNAVISPAFYEKLCAFPVSVLPMPIALSRVGSERGPPRRRAVLTSSFSVKADPRKASRCCRPPFGPSWRNTPTSVSRCRPAVASTSIRATCRPGELCRRTSRSSAVLSRSSSTRASCCPPISSSSPTNSRATRAARH